MSNQSGEEMKVLTQVAWHTEYIFLLEMKQGQCICPLSWSVHCNFTGDGKCKERGWACAPPTLTSQGQFYPHHWMYARKQRLKLCVLCVTHWPFSIRSHFPSQSHQMCNVLCTYVELYYTVYQYNHVLVTVHDARKYMQLMVVHSYLQL
jgi:hypothetical protein